MSSVTSTAFSSLIAATRRLEAPARTVSDAEPAQPAQANIPVAFKIPRIDKVDDRPAIPPGLDMSKFKRANPYADAFGMAVDPTKDIAAEGAAGLFARYDKQVSNVIDRIMKAKFTALLDVKV